MQPRTEVWQEYEQNAHVFADRWMRLVSSLHHNKHDYGVSRMMYRRKRQRELYTKLMGWPCSRQELQRQLIALLLLVAALVLMLSMME